MPDDVRRTTPADIYTELRERICLLDLPAGTILREGDLAEEFGVSRTPVREALQRLGGLGLVESRNGVGTFVTSLDPDLTRQAYEMRMKVAELIGQMTPNPIRKSHLTAIADCCDQAQALAVDFDVRRYFALNHEVHFLIASIIGNAALRENWNRLYFQTARAWYTAALDLGVAIAADLVRELDGVRQALECNDPVALGYVQRNHIAYAYRHVCG